MRIYTWSDAPDDVKEALSTSPRYWLAVGEPDVTAKFPDWLDPVRVVQRADDGTIVREIVAGNDKRRSV